MFYFVELKNLCTFGMCNLKIEIMEKYLMTIEFRYSDATNYEDDSTCRSKEVTIGVYDSFEEACKGGNKILGLLESKYKLNPNYNKKERFSENGGCFGGKRSLISNLGYLVTPFAFYAKITTLKYDSVEEIIGEVADSMKRYKEYNNNRTY